MLKRFNRYLDICNFFTNRYVLYMLIYKFITWRYLFLPQTKKKPLTIIHFNEIKCMGINSLKESLLFPIDIIR